uniref:Reverse transcriptase Ty1/copia-type domain-containing protein n=1 Tax=Chromera velia CCMP2878 TaxID=1169474 RepID=A0A0G4HWJ6_9ALVE|eukprot:Cvel_9077.t1-p1 / transcript=Cvel_9077.t1 / gene=Cvel_9077 / organism=Chromera_velia_CCMP2878 / gene_product=hypothetical protein / transcript_product=hypothetical protein / location=Cvel_scaffold515:13717-16657(-) / protein_length=431 / sequence_SO=supercontig / SO=protein_coding / is_pseudo=false
MANPTAPKARSGANARRPSTAVGVETRGQRKAKGKAEVSVSAAAASAASSAAVCEGHPRHGEMGSMDSLKDADEAKQGERDGEEEEGARGGRRVRKGSEDEGIPPAAMATSFRGGVSLRPATVEEVRAGKLEAARLDEFVGILDNGVIGGEVSRSQVVYVVNMGENLGIKKKGKQEKAKARIFTDERWVELRQEAAELQPGSIHLLAKAHYGGRGSGNLFCGLFQREMQSLGGYEVVDESVLVKRKGAGRDGLKGGKPAARSAADALVVHFVDDVRGSGAGVKRDLELLGQRIKLGLFDTLQPGGEDRFVGLDMEMEEGRLFVSQKNYLKTVEADRILHIAGGARRQVTNKCMRPPEEWEVNMSLQAAYRGACGVLGWGTRLLPKKQVYYQELQKYATRPCRRLLQNVGLVLQQAQQEKTRLEFRPLLPEG